MNYPDVAAPLIAMGWSKLSGGLSNRSRPIKRILAQPQAFVALKQDRNMNILQRIRRLSLQYVAGIIGLLGLPGCTMGKLAADDYFSGDYLVAAQAINAGAMEQLREGGQGRRDLDATGRQEISWP